MIKSFLTRLFTSCFILIIFAVIVAASFFDYVFELTISLLSVMCVYEAINAIGFSKKKTILVSSMAYALLVPLSFTLTEKIGKSPYYLVIVLTFLFLISFISVAMINYELVKFNDAATITFASLVITCFLSNIILLRRIPQHGLFLMILAIVCFSWCTDIFAYLVGMCIGKHKFAPNISPKKTIEGSIGGMLFSIVASVIAFIIYEKLTGCVINYPLGIFYAFLCSIIGQIGDLSFSYIKRSYGIKDFGKILPGHGGVLDRLDSLIFLCPFLYMLTTFYNFIS